MTDKPTILVVDDEISNIEIIGAILDCDYEICFATSGDQVIEVAREARPDVILLDIVMPGLDGYEVCRRLKQDSILSDVPVIFTTGLHQTQDEVRGLSVGAIDYVTKPIQPESLRSRVGNHVRQKRMRDRLANLAMTDTLTGLGNRRMLETMLPSEISRLSRSRDWLSVIMMDIDFFKNFNDTYGHLQGDDCIRMVASAVHRAVARSGDICVRYGGEEFACILPGTDHGGAMCVADQMRRQVHALALPNRGTSAGGTSAGGMVTISLGIASARCQPGLTMETWLSNADRLLYRSKETGRNRVTGEVITIASDGIRDDIRDTG